MKANIKGNDLEETVSMASAMMSRAAIFLKASPKMALRRVGKIMISAVSKMPGCFFRADSRGL